MFSLFRCEVLIAILVLASERINLIVNRVSPDSWGQRSLLVVLRYIRFNQLPTHADGMPTLLRISEEVSISTMRVSGLKARLHAN